MDNKSKRKNMALIIVFGILLIAIIFSASYAYFRVNTSSNGTLSNINGTLDCLDITYSEANVINLSNQYPITDEYALGHITPLNVTVTNNCSANIDNVNYVLALTSLSNATGFIEDSKMRIHVKRTLDGDSEKVFKSSDYVNSLALLEAGYTYNYLSNEINNDSNLKNYTNKKIYRIDNNTIGAGETNTYKIYVWIDYYEGDTTHTGLNDNSTENKTYKYNVSLIVNSYTNKDVEAIFAGAGSESDPYQIRMIEDLVKLSNSVNAGTTYDGKTFALMRSLDFNSPESYEDANRTDFGDINGNGTEEGLLTELTTGSGFTPIGNSSGKSFSGTFNGNNKEINNLYINFQDEKVCSGLGLFGRIGSTVINNLKVSGAIDYSLTKTTNINIGGLIGVILSNSDVTINNCGIDIDITGNSSHTTSIGVGGLIGTLASGGGITLNINDSYNKSNITGESGKPYIGGLIGYNGNNTVNITNSYNDGTITNETGNNAGGLIGSTGGTVTINNSENKNNVTCDECSNIGGLVGSNLKKLTLIGSNNKGNVTSNTSESTSTRVGGLVGRTTGNLTIENSYNSGKISVTEGVYSIAKLSGGLVGYTSSETLSNFITNSYNTGEISGGSSPGGLIGRNQASTLINKCYNTGYVHSSSYSTSTIDCSGGLIGSNLDYDFQHQPLFIINSFNNGNVQSINNDSEGDLFVSGIIGRSAGNSAENYIGKIYIINSYNSGDITSSRFAYGISYTDKEDIDINNVYNYGNVSVTTGNAKYAIGSIIRGTLNLNNVYYDDKVKNMGNVLTDGVRNGTATPMYTSKFNSISFANELNNNLSDIDLSSIYFDESHTLDEYVTLSTWSLGPNGYPVLNNDSH